jgi:hypothetical protein
LIDARFGCVQGHPPVDREHVQPGTRLGFQFDDHGWHLPSNVGIVIENDIANPGPRQRVVPFSWSKLPRASAKTPCFSNGDEAPLPRVLTRLNKCTMLSIACSAPAKRNSVWRFQGKSFPWVKALACFASATSTKAMGGVEARKGAHPFLTDWFLSLVPFWTGSVRSGRPERVALRSGVTLLDIGPLAFFQR